MVLQSYGTTSPCQHPCRIQKMAGSKSRITVDTRTTERGRLRPTRNIYGFHVVSASDVRTHNSRNHELDSRLPSCSSEPTSRTLQAYLTGQRWRMLLPKELPGMLDTSQHPPTRQAGSKQRWWGRGEDWINNWRWAIDVRVGTVAIHMISTGYSGLQLLHAHLSLRVTGSTCPATLRSR